jgi:hypothetical protein
LLIKEENKFKDLLEQNIWKKLNTL